MVNEIFECSVPIHSDTDSGCIERATAQCDNATRETWIRAKYAQRDFVRPFSNLLVKKIKLENNNRPDQSLLLNCLQIIDYEFKSDLDSIRNKEDLLVFSSPNALLHEACKLGDLKMILYSIALNADLNSVIDKIDFFDSVTELKELNMGFTPLINAVNSGYSPAVELLLLNGAKINSCDFRGRTALHHATILKNLRLVCLLLKRGADPLCVDKNDEDPIQIATENCQANIVTILRVAKMNNDLKEQDMSYSGDPMFSDILKDLLSLEEREKEAKAASVVGEHAVVE